MYIAKRIVAVVALQKWMAMLPSVSMCQRLGARDEARADTRDTSGQIEIDKHAAVSWIAVEAAGLAR